MKGDYGKIPPFGALKNKANPKFTLSEVEWANFRRCDPIRLIVIGLFELYQGNPVFAGLAGRSVNSD